MRKIYTSGALWDKVAITPFSFINHLKKQIVIRKWITDKGRIKFEEGLDLFGYISNVE